MGNRSIEIAGDALKSTIVSGSGNTIVVYYQNLRETTTPSIPSPSKLAPNPYKGLLAFQETDGDRFFGRDSQINELWEKFRNLYMSESATRLLTVYGPSGSGKSSLARAGLIPELSRQPLPGRDRARVAVLLPGSHPVEALATVLARIAANDPAPVAKTRELATELVRANPSGEYDGLRRIADILPDIAISPLIVLVDQLEEVFTLCEDPAEREAFIGNLLCAAAERSKRVSVIVTLRSDFLGATQKYRRLNQLIQPQGFFVAAMSEEGLREAITKPAEKAGHPLDKATVNLLIEQTGDRDGALPLLQFALTRIWAGLEEGKEPAETLSAIGGVGGALADEAQKIYSGLTPNEKEIARRVFLGLVQLGEGAKDTRRRADLERLVSQQDNLEQVQKVIGQFADPGARLITLGGEQEAGTQTAEVTHEALFDNWQQLKDWLENSRSDLRFQRRLDEAAIVWEGNGRPEGNLWKPPDLDLLRSYCNKRAGNDMTPLQVEFFKASEDAAKALKQAAENAVKEKKRQQQILSLVLFAGIIFTSGAAIFSTYQLQQAQRQRIEQLAANAKLFFTTGKSMSATITTVAAKGLSQSAIVQFPDQPQFASVDGSLLDAVRLPNQEINQLLQTDRVASVSYSPDGKRIVSGSGDKTVRIWDAQTGQPIGPPLQGHISDVNSVSYSPDGKRIVSGSGSIDGRVGVNVDKTVRIWDAQTGKQIGLPLVGHTDGVNSVAYSSDGKRIFSGSSDKTVRIWDAQTGKQIGQPLQGHTSDVTSVAFSSDGKRIVSGSGSIGNDSKDNTLRIWDAQTGQQIGQPLKGHTDSVNSVSFSPDGKLIVSGSADHTLRIWDISTESLLRTVCNRLRYHPSLNHPTTEDKAVADEAKQSCQPYFR
jgi:WD domain, G-beta repeat/AAA ATPase domain